MSDEGVSVVGTAGDDRGWTRTESRAVNDPNEDRGMTGDGKDASERCPVCRCTVTTRDTTNCPDCVAKL
jgi:hypothetical protein